MTLSARPASAVPPRPTLRDVPRLLRRRGVQIALAGWAVVNVLLIMVARGHLPLNASSLTHPPALSTVVSTDLMFVEVFALMLVVHLLTRRRAIPDLIDRAPARSTARTETLLVIGYGLLAMLGGLILGHAFGWHAFGFHLDGMVIRTGQPIVEGEVFAWAGYNLLAYAVIPLIVFHRRYGAERLNLRSTNRWADTVLILIVLVIESTVQLAAADGMTIIDLPIRQAVLGGLLTFVVCFAGTVLPAMVFIYCILTPRYLRLTGSVSATVILGGLTYALLHLFDGWTSFASPSQILVSVLYLLLFYTGPGMFKTFITIRTGNAWTHVWAYHAIAPHTLLDTPMFVQVFHIRAS